MSDNPIFEKGSCVHVVNPFWDLEIDNETKHQRVRRHAVAKSICSTCPVLVECSMWAEKHSDEIDGVWGSKVYAPDELKYPRCAVCDSPLATTMTAVYRLSSGYVLPHPGNVSVCVKCGIVAGLPDVTRSSRFDGVKEIVANTRSFKITSTVIRRTTQS